MQYLIGFIPYFFSFAFFLFFGFIYEKKNCKKIKISLLIASFFLLFLLCILKDNSVGTDTESYKIQFENSLQTGNMISEKEKGFYLLMLLCAKTFKSFFVFQIICYFIILLCLFIFLSKKSINPFFSLALLIGTPFFTMMLSGLRQTIAISFCLLSTIFFDKKSIWGKILSIIIVLFSLLFHLSAFVFLLFYLYKIFDQKESYDFILKAILFYVIFLLLGIYLFYYIYSIIDLGYALSSISFGFPFNSLLYFIIFVFLYFLLLQNNVKEDYRPYIISLLLYCIIMSTSSFSLIMSRFSFYFIPFISVYIVNLLSNDKKIFIFKDVKINSHFLLYSFELLFLMLFIYECLFNNSLHSFPYKIRKI